MSMGLPKWKDSKGKPADKELHEAGSKARRKTMRESGKKLARLRHESFTKTARKKGQH